MHSLSRPQASPAGLGSCPSSPPSARALFLVLLCVTSLSVWAKGPRVEHLKASFVEGFVVASFELGEAFSRQDLREAIESTRPVTLTFTVEVIKKRSLWKDKTLGEVVLQRRISYDTLTRQYAVETTLDGETVDSITLGTYGELEAAAGVVGPTKICRVADMEPDASYQVRAHVKLLDDYTLWVLPWDLETPWAELELNTP